MTAYIQIYVSFPFKSEIFWRDLGLKFPKIT